LLVAFCDIPLLTGSADFPPPHLARETRSPHEIRVRSDCQAAVPAAGRVGGRTDEV